MGTERDLGIGCLLPSLSALRRGSKVIHAARLRVVTVPRGGSFITTEFTALCGANGWAEGGSETGVTCRRCLRSLPPSPPSSTEGGGGG